MLNKKIICITGKSGSGKTTIGQELFNALDAEFINIDKIAHLLYNNKNIVKQIKKCFGNGIFTKGIVNTKKLGNIVFNSAVAMQSLTEITWPAMEEEIIKIINNSKKEYIILDWALLPLTKFFSNKSYNILVNSNDKIRFQKVIMRDNITTDYLLIREANSLNYYAYNFNFIIYNNYDNQILTYCKNLTKNIIKFFKELQ